MFKTVVTKVNAYSKKKKKKNSRGWAVAKSECCLQAMYAVVYQRCTF